jgi:hypothetical protein
VAGLAALLLQNDPFLTISQLETELHNIGLSGNNDLGVAGFDTQYGYGRIRLPDADMSDHPGSYGVAWHANPSDEFSISLGPVNDTDSTATAGSDDDADDGVIRTGPWVQGQTATLNANVVGGPGHLVGWVDWSGDGDFLDGGEEVISQTVAAGSNGLTLSVPGTYTTGTPVQTRFRLYTASPAVARPMGHASDGEVEDYSWSFTPTTVGLQSVEAGRGSMGGSWMVVAAGGALSALTAALLWRRKRGQRASRSQRSMAS